MPKLERQQENVFRSSFNTHFLRKTMVGLAEKRHRTTVFVQKFKTSSFDIALRRTIGFWTEIVVRTMVFK